MERREPLDHRLVQQLQGRVAQALNRESQRREAQGQPELSRGDEQQLAMTLIDQVVNDHLQRELQAGEDVPVDRTLDERLAGAVHAAMFGAGELQDLLDDSDVENIDINGCDEMWVTYAGDTTRGRESGGQPVGPLTIAPTDDDLVAIIQGQAAHAGINARPWTPATPQLDLRLSDGSRLSAVMTAGERPSVSIRRNRYPQMFLPKLVELGTLDEQVATMLQAAVRARMNVMVAGATNAGKTTLLRALINCIDPDERLVTVEKALELGLRRHPDLHPNVVEWEMVLPDAEGRGGISMAALVQRSLRQNPSRVIVGEVLGEEIGVMLNAMSQGNDGSLSTIHARNSVAVLDRIASYAAQAENLSFEVTHSLIAGAIDFIVFIRQNPFMGGLRTVAEVLEVSGFDGERVTHSDVFVASDVNGRAVRSESAISEPRLKRLEAEGYNDRSFFGGLMLPSVDGLLMAIIAAGFGGGLVLLAVFIHGVTPQPAKPPNRFNIALQALRSPALSGRIAGGVIVGILALVLTHWPVAAIGIAALVIFWPQMFGGQRVEENQILQLEALVMWTESLRDTITARASLEQAIPATAGTAPSAIRPALTRLTGLVRSRVPLERALLALSAELNDGSADKVIGSLILNTRQRGTGLAVVLTSLAASARAELDQRRRVSAGRATMRRSVQIVVIITIVFAVFLVLFSQAYVRPYGTFGGQVALAVVVAFFASAFMWMRKLAGGEPNTPFLSRADARIGDADLRVVAHLTGLSAEQAQELTTNRPAPAPGSSTTGAR